MARTKRNLMRLLIGFLVVALVVTAAAFIGSSRWQARTKALLDGLETVRVRTGIAETSPWQGRVWDYEVRDGMRVPLEGEVAWILPDGPKPYWRGRIQRIAYDYDR